MGPNSHCSALIGPDRLRLNLLPWGGERDGAEPGRDCPLQAQGGHRLPGRQEQDARGGGAEQVSEAGVCSEKILLVFKLVS